MHSRNYTLTLVAALLVALGIPGTTFAQTAEDGLRLSMRAPATGARMIGIGTAGFGGFGDYGAMYSNPAGLGLVERSSITGVIQTLRTSDASFSHTRDFEATKLTNQVNGVNVGNFAILYKAPTTQGSLVMGLTYNQVASFQRELRFSGVNTYSTISTSFLPYSDEYYLTDDGGFDITSDLSLGAFYGGMVEWYPELLDEDSTAFPFFEAVIPGTTIEQQGRVTESGRMNEVSLGGSMEVAPGMHVGVALNLVSGRYNFRSRFEEDDFRNENQAGDYSVFLDNGDLYEGFNYLKYGQRLESDLVGLSLRAGISAEIMGGLRVGASIETPTRHSVDETYGRSFETHFDDGNMLSYGDNPDDVGNGVFSYHLNTPWRVGVGVAWEPFDWFTLLLDAEAVDWTSMRFSSNDVYFDDLNEAIQDNYEEAVNVGVGVELSLGRFVVRGGSALREHPARVQALKSDYSTLNTEQVYVSGGIGYRASQRFRLDVGWNMARYESTYFPYPVDAYGPRQDADLQVDEDIQRHQVAVSLTFSL